MFTITYRNIVVDTVADFQKTLDIVHDLNLDDDYVIVTHEGVEYSTFDLAIAGLFIAAQESDPLAYMRKYGLGLQGGTVVLPYDEMPCLLLAGLGKPTNCSYNTHDGLIWLS